MLTFGIYFLTAVMVIDCIFIVLLVLVQLPKKEAGMGQAFGGAATDALFGAGSGNVLTKATKWGAGVFFALAIALTVMGTYRATSGGPGRLQKIMSENKPAAVVPPPTTTTPVVPAPGVPNVVPNASVPGANNGNPPAQTVPAVPPPTTPAAPAK
ncbi:MAG TPA: preprotein translocase subunit SecG [Methylomirabilota bacterium]|nr:preprotein translocase subunit SecG [Methylomirabilota bacterium]